MQTKKVIINVVEREEQAAFLLLRKKKKSIMKNEGIYTRKTNKRHLKFNLKKQNKII